MSEATETRLAEAKNALRRGDFVQAEKLFQTLAGLGSRPALLALGYIYERGGQGVNRDFVAARHWFERALVEANSVEAALALGRYYYFGLGVCVDFRKAYLYYSKLEGDQHPVALYRLGIMSEKGKGTLQDVARARNLYQRAAKKGHIYGLKNWAVLEIKRGNIPVGLALWGVAIIRGTWLHMTNPSDARLKTH